MREREWTLREKMQMRRRGRKGDEGGCIAWRDVAIEGQNGRGGLEANDGDRSFV